MILYGKGWAHDLIWYRVGPHDLIWYRVGAHDLIW